MAVKLRQKTCKEKYGVDSIAKLDSVKNKRKETNLKKYGVENPMQVKEFKEKAEQTLISIYGVNNASKANEIKEKKKKIFKEKYGVDNISQLEEVKNKIKNTLMSNYGIYHAPSRLYKYQEQNFDSFPELCLYMYCKENDIEIIREPAELTFTFEDKEYHYYPDFLVNNQLVEIKGKQFLKEDGTWCNPYDHSLDKLFEAKHQCALANNVKILYNEDYQKYINWFNTQGYKKEDFIVL